MIHSSYVSYLVIFSDVRRSFQPYKLISMTIWQHFPTETWYRTLGSLRTEVGSVVTGRVAFWSRDC